MKLKSRFYTHLDSPTFYGLADDKYLIEVLRKDIKGNILLGMSNRTDDGWCHYYLINEDAFSKLPFDELIKLILPWAMPPLRWQDDIVYEEDWKSFNETYTEELDEVERNKKALQAKYGIKIFRKGQFDANIIDVGSVPDIHKEYYVEMELGHLSVDKRV